MPVNATSISKAERVAHGAVPHRIESCIYTFKYCLLLQVMLFETAQLPFSSADLALQDTRALAPAEYCLLDVWAQSPLFSGLGAASTTAGRCISAGGPP